MTLESIADGDALETFLDSIQTIVSECRLHLETTGFRVLAVDPANVCSVKTMLGPQAFESYELERRALVGVNLDRFDEAVSFADTDEPIGISTNVDGDFPTDDGDMALAGHLHVQTGEIGHDVAMIDPDSIRKEPNIPDLGLPVEVTLEGRKLARVVRAGDTVSDHIIFGCSDDGVFTATAQGDTDSIGVELAEDDDGVIDLQSADARSLFSLDYLTDIVPVIPADAEVTLKLGTDYPCKLEWQYADGYGTVVFMLAPRIEGEN